MVALSFLLNNIPLYIWIYLTFYPLVYWTLVSTSRLLKIMLQWTRECRYHFEILFHFIRQSPEVGYTPKVGLLDHNVALAFIFWKTSMLLYIVALTTHIPTKNSLFSKSYSNDLIQMWSLTVLLVCTFLTITCCSFVFFSDCLSKSVINSNCDLDRINRCRVIILIMWEYVP